MSDGHGNDARNLRVYLSMKYGSDAIDPVHDIIERAARKVKLEVFRSDQTGYLSNSLREKVLRDIDDSLLVVCEASAFSWYVAFELAHAIQCKPCIILFQEPTNGTLDAICRPQGISALYGDKILVPYSLRSRDHREDLQGKLEEAFRTVLLESEKRTKELTQNIASCQPFKPKSSIDGDYVKPNVKLGDDSFDSDQLCERWKKFLQGQQSQNRPLVLTASPGGGKTVLLSKLWESVHPSNPRRHPTTVHPQLPVFINLGMMNRPVTDRWPWDLIRKDLENTRGTTPLHHGLLEALRGSGQLYLLLDGLDEYGMRCRDKYDVECLLERCSTLAESGVNVVVAGRESYWQLFEDTIYGKNFVKAEVLPFNGSQIREYLKDLPNEALNRFTDENEEFKEWVGSPFMLWIIKHSKTDSVKKALLFEEWAESVAQRDGNANPDEILEFFGELAIQLARKRTQAITEDLCRLADKRQNLMSPSEAMVSQFVTHRESDGTRGLRFVHELVWEFFVAHRLAGDFKKAIGAKPSDRDNDIDEPQNDTIVVENLDLKETQMDYLPSSVYGFLAEKLGEEYQIDLLQWLKDRFDKKEGEPVQPKSYPNELLRNLLEYFGKTFASDGKELADATNVLLSMLECEELSSVVRYNAARALERIHPSSPRPYYDYMSQWGEVDWSESHFEEWPAWAVRGASLADREPGDSPKTLLDFSKSADKTLQENVAIRLLKVLRNCPHTRIQLNVSHALIRWCSSSNSFAEKLAEVQTRCSDENVLKNLNKYVPKAMEEFGFQTARYVNSAPQPDEQAKPSERRRDDANDLSGFIRWLNAHLDDQKAVKSKIREITQKLEEQEENHWDNSRDEVVVVHTHVHLDELLGQEIAGESRNKLSRAADRAAKIDQVAQAQGKDGFLCITITDESYHKVFAADATEELRNALNEEHTERLREIMALTYSKSDNVLVFYAPKHIQLFFDRFTSFEIEQLHRLLLGSDSGIRYDVSKSVFALIQILMPGFHLRIDDDVTDVDGALYEMLTNVDVNNLRQIVSGRYITDTELARIKARRFQDLDYRVVLNDFATRTELLLPAPPKDTTTLEKPALAEAKPIRRKFVENAVDFLNLVDETIGVTTENRVTSGPYLTVSDDVWQEPSFSLLAANSVWCDDVAIGEVRDLPSRVIESAALEQHRYTGMGPDLEQVRDCAAKGYLMGLLRGVALIACVRHQRFQFAMKNKQPLESWSQDDRVALWNEIQLALKDFAVGLEKFDDTVIGAIAKGDLHPNFSELKKHEFVDKRFPNGILPAIHEMQSFGPMDEDAPEFCQQMRQLIDDVIYYSSDELRTLWRKLIDRASGMGAEMVFPSLLPQPESKVEE